MNLFSTGFLHYIVQKQ